ncbi:MAG: sensor histidine kinase [Opitutaceae bacterium]
MNDLIARLPIREKLIAAIVFTSAFVLLITLAAGFAFEYRSFGRRLEREIASVALIVADNSTAAIAFRDTTGAQQTLDALRAEPQIVAATLFDLEGNIFATYPAGADPEPLVMLDGMQLVDGLVVSTLEVKENERRLGTLRIKASRSEMFQRLRVYGLLVLTIGGIAIGVAWLIASTLERRITLPIRELVRVSRSVTEKNDYSLRAAVYDRNELGQLTESFNAMLGRIESGIDALERSAHEIQELNSSLERRVRLRTAQLEEANRELESFSYSVSHDLRAPLRHIQGFGEMLVDATQGQLPPKAQRYLKIITDSSGEMGQLIDDLLAFSRMGRSEVRESTVNLSTLVEQVRAAEETGAPDRSLSWNISPLPEVRGDEAMLKLVLVNLIGNAVKFTRHRELAEIHIGSNGVAGGMATLFVRDNGAGFDMAYYDKLFGVFQRLHRAEEFEGTGIGLANVRRIINRHGGSVWAESAPDQGATFFFTLRT